MQLGTNSVDTPRKDAVLSKVALQENDIVLALSDGVMDNLWEHEVLKITLDSLKKWDDGHVNAKDVAPSPDLSDDRMVYAARELLNAALNIAQDPFAESPYMEKAVDEGIAIEGGELNAGWSMCFHDKYTDYVQAKWTISLLWLRPVRSAADDQHLPTINRQFQSLVIDGQINLSTFDLRRLRSTWQFTSQDLFVHAVYGK